jgi:D-alanyl-D-alanine carboxypeptidase
LTLFLKLRPRVLPLATAAALLIAGVANVKAEALLLVEASTGKVLHAENATYPWYPASVTKLMTLYTTLRAIKEGKVKFDTLLEMSRNAVAQRPTKMGFKLGTEVTIDNALKMLMVKSANDIAVAIAEGVGGSIEGFADMMNANARRLGMTQTNYVNPNGLPAENHVTSARDLAKLARALINDFPQYDFYWHISSIKYGNRIYHNYNSLIGRYPGADGMKTGFICASGYNLVASATRNGRRLIAIVLGAYSSGVRAQKAGQMLENGFRGGNLSWLTPSLGTVDNLAPVDAQPPNLHDEMCGGHRRKPPAEDNDEEEVQASTPEAADGKNFMLSSLNKQAPEKFVLGPAVQTVPPIVVFTGPANNPDKVIQTATAKSKKHRAKKSAASAKASDTKESAAKNESKKENKKEKKPKAKKTEATSKHGPKLKTAKQ